MVWMAFSHVYIPIVTAFIATCHCWCDACRKVESFMTSHYSYIEPNIYWWREKKYSMQNLLERELTVQLNENDFDR